ncbi:MAG: carboxylate--amine ligase, partial [Actinobacteria bacterium]|nr:carboxylate--amine ligase [Actinomycetota bacterium]
MSITLSEAESRRIVSGYGVPVSPFVTGTSTAEVLAAVEADASVTFPVVAKLCGRAIAHKTERGLVRLRIADTDALAAACDELLGKAVPDDGEVEVLVSTMVDGNRELI